MKRPFSGTPPDEDSERSRAAYKRALQRYEAIASITPGEVRHIERRTLAEQVRLLQKEGHPLKPSVQTLSAWRIAFLGAGRKIAALLDGQRGGSGGYRGKMADPEVQVLIVECEKPLIVTSHKEFPPLSVLRGKLIGRLGKDRLQLVPSEKAIDRFRRTAIPYAERVFLAKGERGYSAGPMPKPPAQIADRHGVVLVVDHKQSDVLVLWLTKEIRPWLTTATDPYSGACRGLHVSPFAPGSTEIALALWSAIREKPEDRERLLCGTPEYFYSDQGEDMRSLHLEAALADLGISRILARPYCPWARASAEGNLHSTIARALEIDMPGYVTNDPKSRPVGLKAVLSFNQYQVIIRRKVLVEFNQLIYQKRLLPDGRKGSRLDFARTNHVPPRVPSDETLMLALLKREKRTVQPSGITVAGMFVYWHDSLYCLAEEQAQVEVRFDPADMSKIYVFHEGKLLCQAEDPRAASVGATERTARERYKLRGERKKYLRDATRPDREAAMDPATYLEHLEATQATEERAVAAGGTTRPIRQMIPHLDHAAAQLRTARGRPTDPAGPRRASREPTWKDPYDRPVEEKKR